MIWLWDEGTFCGCKELAASPWFLARGGDCGTFGSDTVASAGVSLTVALVVGSIAV